VLCSNQPQPVRQTLAHRAKRADRQRQKENQGLGIMRINMRKKR
jgi:hypothetical protein